jgi:hypothetical protein
MEPESRGVRRSRLETDDRIDFDPEDWIDFDPEVLIDLDPEDRTEWSEDGTELRMGIHNAKGDRGTAAGCY